jgi:hypothetical protein
LAWHPDRLARNSVDGGKIIYLIDCGRIAAMKFPQFWFEPTPQGKFMLNIAFGQSKSTRRGRLLFFPIRFILGYSATLASYTKENTSQSSQRNFLIRRKRF